MDKAIWAEPRDVTSLNDCIFYHTMDIPNFGIVDGDWDLRGREPNYLGNVIFKGKRVLEIGTASGHLCFTMERMGAEVSCYDLSDKHEWDMVPYVGYDYQHHIAERKKGMCSLNNGFWLAHKAFNSTARIMYGTVYDVPNNIGQFEISTLCSILLHLRDPFLALQRISVHVQDTIIVTDLAPSHYGKTIEKELHSDSHLMRFLPNAKERTPFETWWVFSPKLVSEFLHILGFVRTEISFHQQKHRGREVSLFTIVAHRR